MFTFNIGQTPVVFSKFFDTEAAKVVLGAIPEGTKRVVFIDTAATTDLVVTINALINKGIDVVVRDHHDVPNPVNSRQQEIATAAKWVRDLIGDNAVISDRETDPACSTLIKHGEFVEAGTILVADPDADGLTAAMKALGISYDALDADAAILDGARSEQTAERLSPIGLLLVKGLSTLPAYDANRPQASEDAKSKLFQEFVEAQSDADALAKLEARVAKYEANVAAAQAIATLAVELLPGVVLANAVGKTPDLVTLAQLLEARPGCRITVIKKDVGPIAAASGTQYSLAVPKAHQASVNLQELLPNGFVSAVDAGIISNLSFLLHVSEKVWTETVVPALRALTAVAAE